MGEELPPSPSSEYLFFLEKEGKIKSLPFLYHFPDSLTPRKQEFIICPLGIFKNSPPGLSLLLTGAVYNISIFTLQFACILTLFRLYTLFFF